MRIRFIILLLQLVFFSNLLTAQKEHKFYGEIHVLRFARDNGLDFNDAPPFAFSYFNGIEVGYKAFNNFHIYTRYRGIPLQFTTENNRIERQRNRRLGLSVGVEYTRKPERKFYISYSLGYFWELSKDKGGDCFQQITSNTFERISREKIFRGISYQVNFNYKIQSKIYLVLSLRNRTGSVFVRNNKYDSNVSCRHTRYSGESFAPLSKAAIRVFL